MPYQLFDFADIKGNRIQEWAADQPKAQIGKLNNRLDMLERAEADLVTGLLDGTSEPSIYKIKIQGNPKLRPMLCRGPVDVHAEFTILLGAREIQWKLVPPATDATKRRNLILAHGNFRCPHVRFQI